MVKKISMQYICTYCGKKVLRHKEMGRPDPGKCPRRKGDMPHRWVKNKEM